MSRLRLGVLASGRGSTLQALLDASRAGTLPADVVLVLSNRPGALALERARQAGLPAVALPQQWFAGSVRQRDAFFAEHLRRHRVDLVALAGYDRVLDSGLLDAFPSRVINIHPSLLPAFAGTMAPRPQADALARGCKLTGATVHYVVPGDVDGGPIIAQRVVPIYDDDTTETLVARLLPIEHQLLIDAITGIATGQIRLEGDRVVTGRVCPGQAISLDTAR